MLRSYALAPETIRRLLRRLIWRFQIITTLSFLAFGLYLAFFGGPVRWEFALPLLSFIAVVYFFVIFFNYRQQLRTLYTTRYEIDGSSLTHRQHGANPLRINRADIKSVEAQKNGLWIETFDPRIHLLIPYGLARSGDEDIRETLSAWKDIQLPPGKKNGPRGVLLLFGLGGAFLVLIFANSLWVALALGVFLLAFGLYAERRLIRIRDVPPGVARMYSLAFSFLVFITMMKSCFLGFEMLAGH